MRVKYIGGLFLKVVFVILTSPLPQFDEDVNSGRRKVLVTLFYQILHSVLSSPFLFWLKAFGKVCLFTKQFFNAFYTFLISQRSDIGIVVFPENM